MSFYVLRLVGLPASCMVTAVIVGLQGQTFAAAFTSGTAERIFAGVAGVGALVAIAITVGIAQLGKRRWREAGQRWNRQIVCWQRSWYCHRCHVAFVAGSAQAVVPDSPLVQELKTLTRNQNNGLIQSQTRLVNQLTACLKAYYPVALQLVSKLHQPTTLAFVRAYPTPELARAASVEALAQTLVTAGHRHAAQVAPQIWQTLQEPQLNGDVVTMRTKARLMLALVAQLAPLIEQIAAYDEEIT